MTEPKNEPPVNSLSNMSGPSWESLDIVVNELKSSHASSTLQLEAEFDNLSKCLGTGAEETKKSQEAIEICISRVHGYIEDGEFGQAINYLNALGKIGVDTNRILSSETITDSIESNVSELIRGTKPNSGVGDFIKLRRMCSPESIKEEDQMLVNSLTWGNLTAAMEIYEQAPYALRLSNDQIVEAVKKRILSNIMHGYYNNATSYLNDVNSYIEEKTDGTFSIKEAILKKEDLKNVLWSKIQQHLYFAGAIWKESQGTIMDFIDKTQIKIPQEELREFCLYECDDFLKRSPKMSRVYPATQVLRTLLFMQGRDLIGEDKQDISEAFQKSILYGFYYANPDRPKDPNGAKNSTMQIIKCARILRESGLIDSTDLEAVINRRLQYFCENSDHHNPVQSEYKLNDLQYFAKELGVSFKDAITPETLENIEACLGNLIIKGESSLASGILDTFGIMRGLSNPKQGRFPINRLQQELSVTIRRTLTETNPEIKGTAIEDLFAFAKKHNISLYSCALDGKVDSLDYQAACTTAVTQCVKDLRIEEAQKIIDSIMETKFIDESFVRGTEMQMASECAILTCLENNVADEKGNIIQSRGMKKANAIIDFMQENEIPLEQLLSDGKIKETCESLFEKANKGFGKNMNAFARRCGITFNPDVVAAWNSRVDGISPERQAEILEIIRREGGIENTSR